MIPPCRLFRGPLPRRVRRLLWGLGLSLLTACAASTARRLDQEGRDFPAGVIDLRWHTLLHDQKMAPHPEECATGVAAGDRFVVGSRGGAVMALDVAQGRVLWSTPISGAVDSEARFDPARNQVYVGTDDGSFYALDVASGKIRWMYKAKGALERMPELAADTVFVSTATDKIYALDANSGRWRWQYERDTPEGFTIHGHAGPRLRDGWVYTGFSDGFLVALHATDGSVAWARSLSGASEQFVDVDSTPAFFADQVIASSYSGGLYALDARSGEVRWRQGIEGAGTIGIVGNRLYLAAPRDGLTALQPDGQVLWRQGLAEAGDLTSPIGVGRYLLFTGSRAGLFVVERQTGKLLQTFNPGRGICGAPAYDPVSGTLFVLSNAGTLYAVGLAP